MALDETNVVELNFDCNKIFFYSIIKESFRCQWDYRIREVYSKLEKSSHKIHMQCFSQETLMDIHNWWQGGDSTPEGNTIEDLTTMLGLTHTN